jgi:hypothetical protein
MTVLARTLKDSPLFVLRAEGIVSLVGNLFFQLQWHETLTTPKPEKGPCVSSRHRCLGPTASTTCSPEVFLPAPWRQSTMGFAPAPWRKILSPCGGKTITQTGTFRFMTFPERLDAHHAWINASTVASLAFGAPHSAGTTYRMVAHAPSTQPSRLCRSSAPPENDGILRVACGRGSRVRPRTMKRRSASTGRSEFPDGTCSSPGRSTSMPLCGVLAS